MGGIKEKVIAASRNGLREVILPEGNRKDAEDIPEDVRDKIQIHYVGKVEQALELALEKEVDEQ